ncbi:MAG: tetratricopeptide repeat protein [Thermodesulfobacteriota bacterium]
MLRFWESVASPNPLLGPVIACFSLVLMIGGCGKKPLRNGVPFGLDVIPMRKVASPPPEETWKEKGMRLVEESKYEEAIEAFKRHIVEDPEGSFGFNALAVCYKNLGDQPQAMRNYERALELVTSSEEKAKILSNIGNLYFSANKPQAALGFYKEAHAIFANNPLYPVLIARTFIVLQEYDRARKALEQAEKLRDHLDKYEREEDRGLASYLMAHSYAALNEEEKVREYLKKALKANPKKYVRKLKKDLSDEKNLLYTLKEDTVLSEVLDDYSLHSVLYFGFNR